MLVRGFPAQAFGTNCFVAAPGPGQECIVVDPGIGVEQQLDDLLKEFDLRPVAVLLTHGHLDHTFSVSPVCGARGIAAYIHPDDRDQLADPMKYFGGGDPFGGRLTYTAPDDVRLLDPTKPMQIAGLHVDIDFAPGHTPGSVMFRMPGSELDGEATHPVLISGDVLFAGSIGRTDLAGGSFPQMQESLRSAVLPLPDETVVLPGHGPATTIGRERATNPFLLDLLADGPGAPPPARGL
ncbi:MAG: beta-lactamase domain protein [Frankiales bacterium]|nr:beta-lactamase domain protein [Frankiales bacterium]